MKKISLMVPSCLLIFTLLGCVTTDPDLGKTLPYNYYVCNCESLPANGFIKTRDLEIDFQISNVENNKYLITGVVKTVMGGGLTTAASQNLDLVFFLLKDRLIVDAVKAPLRGDVRGSMSLKKNFISEEEFDGITLGRITGQAWEFI